MKLAHPSYKIIEQKPGIEGIYEMIEFAGRTCYQSEPKEGKTSKEFVDGLIARKHLSVLEHGTVYLHQHIDGTYQECLEDSIFDKYEHNPYSKSCIYFTIGEGMDTYISTNYRVLYENGWLDDLKYLCEPTEFHEKRVTVKFVSMIQFYKDLTRHRKTSYSIESTRYCNYSKGKFGSEVTFIIPSWLDLEEGSYNSYEIENLEGVKGAFLKGLKWTEEYYLQMVNIYKMKPQQAAKLLPQDTKADIVVTGFISDWNHIFSQRTSIIAETGQPDTEVSLLMDPLYNEFKIYYGKNN